MHYSFDVDVSNEYGVEGAVMIQNLYFWISKNKANNKNCHDGRYWTYNSTKAFEELFPFWTNRQIERILRNLEKEGAILTGNYNKSAYDRTKWYALTDECICIIEKIHLHDCVNQFSQNDQPIPDINTDNKTNNIYIVKNETSKGKDTKQYGSEISQIRKLYPGTKTKKVADNKLPKLIKEYGKEQIIRTIERYINEVETKRKDGFKTLNYKNEGTFWNGGYMDYLDENYESNEIAEPAKEEVKYCGKCKNGWIMKLVGNEVERIKCECNK